MKVPSHLITAFLFSWIFNFALASKSLLDSRSPSTPPLIDQYFDHSRADRINTDTIIYRLLNEEHQGSDVTVIPINNCNLFAYAAAGHASSTSIASNISIESYSWRFYSGPTRRIHDNGTLGSYVMFGIYSYLWQDTELLVYVVDGRDGSYPQSVRNQYVIGPRGVVDELILAAGLNSATLHNEIWVYDGWWTKDAGLWNTMNRSSWDDVILDQGVKDALIGNVLRFFDSENDYKRMGVPWKRGIIFYGPPGNGKTISIKATMHTLYNRSSPIPTLYVKSLAGYGEYALAQIFSKARTEAPCYLVFEDLDSLVDDDLRSYFLNQVDGLEENDGILMVGSTNHLERLDPGIAKRPSRFDRKFLFPNPDLPQRKQYCQYWRTKLASSPEIEFPAALVDAIANITDGFSFAYIQEAFVSSLLLIAGGNDELSDGHTLEGIVEQPPLDIKRDELEGVQLWKIIRHQIQILREELEGAGAAVGSTLRSGAGVNVGFGRNRLHVEQGQQMMMMMANGVDLEESLKMGI